MARERPLHRLERKVLLSLLGRRGSSLDDIVLRSRLMMDQVRRAVEWLREKALVDIQVQVRQRVELEKEGRRAVKQGLPEGRLLEALEKLGGEASIQELSEAYLPHQEFSAAFGHAKAKGWINVTIKKNRTLVRVSPVGQLSREEALLRKLKGGAWLDGLSKDERKDVDGLAKRPNFIVIRPHKEIVASLTELGERKASSIKRAKEIRKAREIDVEAVVPITYSGKKHPVQRFIDEVREAFISLGFEEIVGPLIQPAFWNFDALFVPQDHPARDMQDTFYISEGADRGIRASDLVGRVARVHDDGGDTGSRGWRYGWKLEESRRLVLRTHTTAVTVKYLADHRPSQAKVFSVGKVFRNEKLDPTHLAEHHQIEGIVVGKRVTLRDLMGILSEFYEKLGLKKVKFWPTYFPYTEPSMQSIVHVEGFGWMELCGMGIFRPEVTLPLGVKNPVLAWGGGLERLIMARLGVKDIRRLYENELGWLRRIPLCL